MSVRIINEDTPDFPIENFDGYINDQIAHYMKTKHRDEELCGDFRLDFAKWSNEDFNKISQRTRGILRSFLRDNGIYMSKTDTVAEGLSKLLDAREPAEWPDKELSKIIAAGGFNSRRNPDLPGSYAYLRRVEQETKTAQVNLPSPTSNSSYSKPQPTLKLESEDQEFKSQKDEVQPAPRLIPAVQGDSQQSMPSLQNYPSGDSSHGSSYGVQTLHKIYQKEDKYSGAEDVLDKKLRIFYDLCYKANVNPPDYPRAFATMLTGEARDYYFNRISGMQATLTEMIRAIRDYFETEQRQERRTTEWEDTRLEDYKAKYPEKSLLECFDIMRDQLVNNQAILRPELQSDAIIRDKLYRACRDVRECNMALFRRSPTFQGASEDIRNSLAIQSRNVTQGTFAVGLHNPDNSEIFYTDQCWYNGVHLVQCLKNAVNK